MGLRGNRRRWAREIAEKALREAEAFRGAAVEVHAVSVVPVDGRTGVRRLQVDVTVTPLKQDQEWHPLRLHLATPGATRETDVARLHLAEMPLPDQRGMRSKEVRMVEVRADGSHTGAYQAVTGRRRILVVVDCPDAMGEKLELRYGGMTLVAVEVAGEG